MNHHISLNGNEQTFDAMLRGDFLTITYAGQTFELRIVSAENNHILAEHNGQLLRIAGRRDGDRRQIWVNGRSATYQRVTDDRLSAEATQGSLSSSIPAVVSEILVSVGDAIQAGDKLILLESMKMIIPIQAPTDGIVARIDCAVGESVQPGVPLITLA